MIKDLRNTIKQTAIYGVSNILVKAAGLILIPIYAASLSTADYGMLAMFELITQFFVGVISFSLPASMLRLGSDTSNEARQNSIYFTALILLIIFGAAFLALFIPLNGVFSRYFFDSDAYSHYFTISFISIVIEILGILPLQLLRLREKSGSYTFYFSVKLAALVGFIWYFVAWRDMGVYGALIGILCANTVLLIATFAFQFKNIIFKFDRTAAREMYAFGAPLIFTTIAGTTLVIADRIIIEMYGAYTDVGIYTIGYKIGSLSNLLIIGSFALGFLPIAFKKFGDANFKRFYSKMHTYYVGLNVMLTLGISLFAKEIIKLISSTNPDYWSAVMLVPFIAYVFLFKAIYNYFTYTFLLIKQTKIQAYITIVGVLLNIAVNFILIPKYGMYGAIAATGISYVAMAIMAYKFAQAKYPISYEFKRIAVLMISCAIFIAIGIYFNDQSLILRIVIKASLCLAFIALIYFLVADKVEREKVKKLWQAFRSGNLLNPQNKISEK